MTRIKGMQASHGIHQQTACLTVTFLLPQVHGQDPSNTHSTPPTPTRLPSPSATPTSGGHATPRGEEPEDTTGRRSAGKSRRSGVLGGVWWWRGVVGSVVWWRGVVVERCGSGGGDTRQKYSTGTARSRWRERRMEGWKEGV